MDDRIESRLAPPGAMTTCGERRTASGHWLPPGFLFSAVVIPVGITHAAVGLPGPGECAPQHAEVLETAAHTPDAPVVLTPPRRTRIGSTAVVETGTGTLPAYTETLPRSPESAQCARRLVDLALDVWGMGCVLRDSADLVVSELVTNAIQYARRGSVRVTVTRLGDNRVQVAVVDLSWKHPEIRAAGADEESGRGLEIVDALSGGRWGVEPMPRGKRVWAECTAEEAPSGE